MANYYGTTVSEGGKLKPASKEAVEAIIAKYNFGELNVRVSEENELEVWGECSTEAYDIDDKERDGGEIFDQFLSEITPYLDETLIVSEVGNEKCRYVQAFAYIASPNKRVVCTSLDEAITNVINNKL